MDKGREAISAFKDGYLRHLGNIPVSLVQQTTLMFRQIVTDILSQLYQLALTIPDFACTTPVIFIYLFHSRPEVEFVVLQRLPSKQ